MSGILKKIFESIKLHKRGFVIYLALAGAFAILCILGLYVLSLIVFLLLACMFVNEVILRKIRKQADPFRSSSSVRNVDYLIIGDLCNTDRIIEMGGC